MVSDPPRPSVVTSFESWLTPWNPATSTIEPSSRASRSRCGLTCTIRASPCLGVVTIPACEPVKERAWTPSEWMAIATSALEMRSPAVSSMSSSRGGGAGETWSARSSRSSVVSPMAETTTTTSLPSLCVRTIRSATFLMRSASCTDDPPYFCTTRATADLLSWPRGCAAAASGLITAGHSHAGTCAGCWSGDHPTGRRRSRRSEWSMPQPGRGADRSRTSGIRSGRKCRSRGDRPAPTDGSEDARDPAIR